MADEALPKRNAVVNRANPITIAHNERDKNSVSTNPQTIYRLQNVGKLGTNSINTKPLKMRSSNRWERTQNRSDVQRENMLYFGLSMNHWILTEEFTFSALWKLIKYDTVDTLNALFWTLSTHDTQCIELYADTVTKNRGQIHDQQH